jgi:nucleoside-diphosphate-sugar epimerase
MVSRPARGRLLARLDAELIQGDLTRPASLERAVRDIDAVIHLAARATFEDMNSLRPTIVDGTRALATAAVKAGVAHFTYASSMLVYGNSDGAIDGDTPPEPRLDYGRAKLEAEAAVTEVAGDSGMELAVIRLPHIYGARDLMFEQIRGGRLVLPGRGHNLYAHLHVHDCGRLLAAIAEQGWTGVSPVADDHAADWREFIGVVCEHFPRVRVHWAPAWLSRAGTEILSLVVRWRSVPSLLTPGAVIGFNLSQPVKAELIWKDLKLAPDYPTIHEGIPAALDDCVAFRWQHPIFDRKGR